MSRRWHISSILINLVNMQEQDMIDAEEAVRRLGVRRATLYAYVSRGQVRAEPHPDDPRRSLYAADDVDRLAGARTLGRSPGRAAARTLDWGLPVMSSPQSLR